MSYSGACDEAFKAFQRPFCIIFIQSGLLALSAPCLSTLYPWDLLPEEARDRGSWAGPLCIVASRSGSKAR